MQGQFSFWRIFFFCCWMAVYLLQSNNSLNAQPTPSLPLPPTHLRGHQVANQFVSQTDIVNVIAWNPPQGGTPPVAYHIFRNSDLTELAAIIPANEKLTFKDHNRKRHHIYTYFIVSVDAAGDQSDAIGIRFKGAKTHLLKPKAQLISIQVTPVNPSIAVGFEAQFTAVGLFSNQTTKNLTNQVRWSSTNEHVAVVSNASHKHGLAKGLKPGSTTISATLNGISGSTTLEVTAASLVSIEIDPVNPSIAVGFEVQFTAIGHFNDLTTENLTNQVKWSSSHPNVAVISNASGIQGLAKGIKHGSTEIQASLNGVTGSTTLTVTKAVLEFIEVTPIDPSLASGFTLQFTAMGLFNDGTTENLTDQVTWISSEPFAEISNDPKSRGLATAVSVGNTIITARLDGVSGSTSLTVTSATLVSIDVTPVDSMLAEGFTQQFTAIGTFSDNITEDLTNQVTWISSEPFAEISNDPKSRGLATAVSVGTTTITAQLNGVTGSTTLTVTSAVLVSIDVTPVDSMLAEGFTQQFTAIGTFSQGPPEDLTNQVTWMSDNPTVAEISNAQNSQGLATGLKAGTTTITATLDGISDSTTLTVTAAVLINIDVTPANPTIFETLTQEFTATGTFSSGPDEDLTNQVTWISSNTGVAGISNAPGSQGVATGISQGSTTITAMLKGVSGETTLTVAPCPVITFTTETMDSFLPDATVGQEYNVQLETAGGIDPIFSLISGSLPNGLTLSTGGLISGVPADFPSVFTFTVQATSTCGSFTTEEFNIDVLFPVLHTF
jgi:trimeric autotransporter adhesin